jgi:uncharacterized phage protein gp47/JayE
MSTPNVPVPGVEALRDNAARYLQQALAEATQAAGPAALGATDLDLARSNLRALAFMQAMGVHGAYRYLRDFVARQAVPTSSAGAFLDGWLEAYGLPRKPASAAVGTATGTGVNGSVLPEGTLLQTAGGVQLRSTAAATVAAGAISVPVAAVLEGLAGNVAVGTPLALLSPVSGVDSNLLVATGGLTGGAELEADAQALERLAQRLANVPLGGAPADYARWALQVAGITRAWGVRNPAGPCTAGVIIMADVDGVATLPSTGQREAVEAYIRDPLRGPPDELFVIIPTLVELDFTIAVAPDSTAIRARVLDALRDLFFREAAPGQPIAHTHVTAAISSVVGETNHVISAPAMTIGGFFTVSGFDRLLALGEVTWA